MTTEEIKTKVSHWVFDAMVTDGAHHKQWYLHQIVKNILDPQQYKSWREWFLDEDDNDTFDEGTPP